MKLWQSITDRLKSPEQRLADAKRDFEQCLAESAEKHEEWEQQRAAREARQKREQELRQQEEEARRKEHETRLAQQKECEMEAAARPVFRSPPKPAEIPPDIRLFLLSLRLLKQPEVRPTIEAGPPYPLKLLEQIREVERDFESMIRVSGFCSKHLTSHERYALMEECGSLGDRRIWGWLADRTPTKQQFLEDVKKELLDIIAKDASIGDIIAVIQSLEQIEQKRKIQSS